MYQNIDNMICDADSCEAAICECKRMRKADITAAIIWAAVAVSAFLLILLDAILDINIGDVVAYILLFVLSVPRERFLDIASKLDSLAFDDDPYEYHDNEGVESISDIADNLLNPTYRKAIIKALQDKQEYYAEDEFDDAHIAERATDILDNLAEIFGSDEQKD